MTAIDTSYVIAHIDKEILKKELHLATFMKKTNYGSKEI